ncbi:MAG: hypothetical protein HC841_06380, partial [Verrucomicrobiae bacterium]|nr:hypothetical protein [Verrucomicrobiae bacterium]
PWETPDAFDAGTLLFNRAGVYMSPPVPPGGLTAAHAGAWVKFWDTGDHDPDTVCAAVTGIGGLRSFGGHLYWGTMNIPLLTSRAHTLVFGAPASNAESNLQLVNSWRAISIFRATNFQFGIPQVRLLYGETNLASRSLLTGAWRTNFNASGQTPLFGRSGMGSFNNLYTWTMAEHRGQLFVGTLNISGVITRFDANDGAHLFCFPSSDEPARPVSLRGVGNPANYGVRTMLSDSNGLYLGMANPMNLLTSTNGPRGGWELIRLVRRYDDRDWDELSDEFETTHFGGSTNGVPMMDSDGDGMNELAEFRAGTDPTNRFDLLSLNAMTMPPGGEFAFHWFGATGRVYHVQHRAHLDAASNAWNTIGSVTGQNAQVHFMPPLNSTQGWYRVEAQFEPVAP